MNKHVEAILIAVLYLFCLYWWTLPFHDNTLPYGEVDASSHYAIVDYTLSSDRSITDLPAYIDKRYGTDNVFKNHILWYPPSFHYGLAIASVFGGDVDLSIYLANAVFCSLIVLSAYFLMRKFYGIEAALLSSWLLIFSIRDILIYLWGQWPERMAFAYLPLVMYTFYMHMTDKKPIYLYLLGAFSAITLLIHPMVFFHAAMAVIVMSILFFFKRSFSFSLKHTGIASLIFLIIIASVPFQSLNVIKKMFVEENDLQDKGDLSRLFSWFKPQANNPGVPASYFSYTDMIGPLWTVIFVLLGIVFLLLRRNAKDLVMLAWIVSLYIMIHLDFFGKGRVHRSLSGTGHLFYPLMALGVIFIVSFIPVFKQYVKYIAVVAFAVLLFFSFGKGAIAFLSSAYSGVERINPSQYDLAGWMREQPNTDIFYHIGSLSLAKTRWIWMIGQHYAEYDPSKANFTHVIVDYSDMAAIGNGNAVAGLQEWEKQNANLTSVFTNQYIKVYKLET